MSLAAFVDYQAEEAWTWEHMALTRARVIAGPAEFAARVEAAIRTALTLPHDPQKLKDDVLSMRRRLEEAKGSSNPFEAKQAQGGLVDIEFIAQYLMLLHGAAHPDIFSPTTPLALRKLRDAGLLEAGAAETLEAASSLYQGLTQLLRLAVDGPFRPADSPRGLTEMLLQIGDFARPVASGGAARGDAEEGPGDCLSR